MIIFRLFYAYRRFADREPKIRHSMLWPNIQISATGNTGLDTTASHCSSSTVSACAVSHGITQSPPVNAVCTSVCPKLSTRPPSARKFEMLYMHTHARTTNICAALRLHTPDECSTSVPRLVQIITQSCFQLSSLCKIC